MLYSLKRKIRESQFDAFCRNVKRSAPVASDPTGPFVVTLLHNAAVTQYLIAIKSFAQFSSGWDFAILNDGTLSERNIDCLRYHIKGVKIFKISDVADRRLPRGGCWERLTLVSQLSDQKFVVQIDSDTITRNPIPEVQQYVSDGTPFTLAGHPLTRVVSNEEVSDGWKNTNAIAVQSQAERAMGAFSTLWPMYASGCAAFSGYPKKSLPIDEVVRVSNTFQNALGNTWDSWGS